MRSMSTVERDTKLHAEADRRLSQMALVFVQEDTRFGRYLLRERSRRLLTFSWIEVVTLRGGVIVHGDVDTIVFRGLHQDESTGPRAALYWQARYNSMYGREKARMGDSIATEWDEGVARSRVLEMRRCSDIERDAARELWTRLNRGDFCGTGAQWLFGQAIYDATNDAELADAGEVTSWWVYVAQAALRRIVAELEAQDFRKGSAAWFKRAA